MRTLSRAGRGAELGPALALLALLSIFAAPAAAHDLWIVPPSGATVDEAAEVRLRIGHAGHGAAFHRDERRLVRFAAVGPDGRAAVVPGLDGSDPAGVFRPGRPGLWAVVYESRDAFSELPAERFRGYLEEEGLDSILKLRRRLGQEGEPGRELYSRSLKSLVRVGAASSADRAVGLPLELVIETEPERWADGRLRLRLLLRGEPLAGALVDVRRLEDGESAGSRRTDARGGVDFELDAGAWMAAVVHMEAETASSRADWRSLFATLTWAVPAPQIAATARAER